MEFEHNYYAIAVEQDTRTDAMELLIDKEGGVVGPEYGPIYAAYYAGRGGRRDAQCARRGDVGSEVGRTRPGQGHMMDRRHSCRLWGSATSGSEACEMGAV